MDATQKKQEWKRSYNANFEALIRVQAAELMAMTDEEALRQIANLSLAEPAWRDGREWSGLVEQQALFHKRKPA